MAGSDFPLAAAIHALVTVGDVEEKVLFMMLLTKKGGSYGDTENAEAQNVLRKGRRGTWYNSPMVAEVGGMTLFTKKKRASSARKWILFRMRK